MIHVLTFQLLKPFVPTLHLCFVILLLKCCGQRRHCFEIQIKIESGKNSWIFKFYMEKNSLVSLITDGKNMSNLIATAVNMSPFLHIL